MNEAGSELNVSRATVWRLACDGRLPTVKVAGRRIIEPRVLDEFIATNTEHNTHR